MGDHGHDLQPYRDALRDFVDDVIEASGLPPGALPVQDDFGDHRREVEAPLVAATNSRLRDPYALSLGIEERPGHIIRMRRPERHKPRSPFVIMDCTCGAQSRPILAISDRKEWREHHIEEVDRE